MPAGDRHHRVSLDQHERLAFDMAHHRALGALSAAQQASETKPSRTQRRRLTELNDLISKRGQIIAELEILVAAAHEPLIGIVKSDLD